LHQTSEFVNVIGHGGLAVIWSIFNAKQGDLGEGFGVKPWWCLIMAVAKPMACPEKVFLAFIVAL
jgi:hypothetical protein